jgi:hypothetical protein
MDTDDTDLKINSWWKIQEPLRIRCLAKVAGTRLLANIRKLRRSCHVETMQGAQGIKAF